MKGKVVLKNSIFVIKVYDIQRAKRVLEDMISEVAKMNRRKSLKLLPMSVGENSERVTCLCFQRKNCVY